MLSKQLSWRSRSQALIFFSISLLSSNLNSMEFQYKTFGWSNYSQPTADAGILPARESASLRVDTFGVAAQLYDLEEGNALVPEMSEEQKNKYAAYGNTWSELVEVFQDAPKGMQDILEHLIKPVDPEWRAAFVMGPSGIGKTTTSLAIPHIARWYWLFLSGSELAGRNSKGEKNRLAVVLKQAVDRRKKILVIIDDLNVLLENYNSYGNEADTVKSFLRAFLDDQKSNQNFFFIGIINGDYMSDFAKQVTGSCAIHFPLIEDYKKLLIIFKKVMARNIEMAFDSECDDAFLESCFKSLKSEGISLTPRDFENIRFQIARVTRRDDKLSAVRKIKKYHVVKAINELATNYTRSGFIKG